MKEVKAERDHRDYIEQRDPPDTKAADDIAIDVFVTENASGPDGARREMQDVKDDEYE